ncbi:MFS general substrate transporter [Xylona heveae TC161]|uniref:MFS general substrate transporter n=1 Tax=Xylona heveae (strain CBS 132557 / TC161) TaxID=1328760 RepID=A0A165H3N6_XYLHT|nr:MFS general substrate transporter [Xylona heveae TC161]KZF22941.1 MFS general substrate transporter [Xylona heveae TC161]
MENDAAFEAEASAETRLRYSSPDRHRRGSHIGVDATVAAQGGYDKHNVVVSEASPLLGQQSQEDDTGRVSQDEGSSDGTEWHGVIDFEGLPWWKKPSVAWILPPVMLFTLAFGATAVPKINFILSLICRRYLADRSAEDPNFQFLPVILGGNNPQCKIPEVQTLVSRFTLYCNLMVAIPCAILSPKLGALSDRYGRKYLLVLAATGSMITDLIFTVVGTNPDRFSENLLLVSYLIDGICGSFIAAMAMSLSYLSDCTPPAKRAVAFSVFHGCFFGGIAVGPVAAGYIIKATGQLVSIFYIGATCTFTVVIFFVFFLPESVSKQRQAAARDKHRLEKHLTPTQSWLDTLKSANILAPLAILLPTGPGSGRPLRINLLLLAAIDTIIFGVAMGSITVIILYSTYQFGWGSLETGVLVSVANTSRSVCLLIILPLITRLVRGPQRITRHRNEGADGLELAIIRFAIVFDVIGYIGYTLVRTGNLFILSAVVASVGGVVSPTLQSALTKHVPSDRTGQLLGATGLLHALARVVAPTVVNLIYGATVGKFPQTVFVCLASLFGLSAILSWFIKPHVYLHAAEVPIHNVSSHDSGEEGVERSG